MKSIVFTRHLAALCFLGPLTVGFAQSTVVESPDSTATNSFYLGNRPPLAASPFYKLPMGSVTPRGWLRHELELERDGMTGHLEQISPWLDFGKSSWADPQGRGKFGWEELPYWLKGYGDLGYVLKDASIEAEAKKWIDAVLASQREDGYFGPRELLTSLDGKPDLWPHMIMLNVLQSYYEATADPRATNVMDRYFKWENTLPATAFGEGYWPKLRFGDNMESIFWLYNRNGEPWLLDLARKMNANMARWDEGVVNWHNVNIAQGFRAGTIFSMLSHDPRQMASAERDYETVFATYGQFPGGGFVGDENSRPGYIDPRGGIETCGIVELMHSFEMLTKITGKPVWADRCEELAFNTFPAAMTADEKALHYITCDNSVELDQDNKSPDIQNSGTMISYSPYEVYRCCQHNVSHGWPYYAEELWLATPDNGLCASLYSASEVRAKVGDGAAVKITEDTDYPFRETVKFSIDTATPARFPLYLRVPRWCDSAKVSINGKTARVRSKPETFIRLDREWRKGDTIMLQMPMKLGVRRWPKNENAASVDYGPLSFSLAIQERFSKYGDRNPKWPEWDVYPQSPWNYGLVLNKQNPASSFKLIRAEGPLATQPFTPETAPIKLEATGRRIPNWKADSKHVVGRLQPSPVKSDQPNEKIILIPMGAARLRISMFPVIGSGPDAHEWGGSARASASHSFEGDTLDALQDGLEPANSNDHTIPRFTWWDHRGTREWVQLDFPQPKSVSSAEVYWFDDTGVGQCRIPASWRLLYRDGNAWKEVSQPVAVPISPDKWNALSFHPVQTDSVRIEAQLRPDFSGGILGWRVK
ncbi:MAG TPA: beta-L-arabinofuranosidase domain-containing protein [Verrucomicrobiae bacterium]|nr:beta-L-arabinofuranosidase domain-containing protein [Verrucomicrobiae bacterium]